MRKQIKADLWGSPVIPVAQPVTTKASAAAGAILQSTSPGQVRWHGRNYHTYAKEGYCENAEVHACIGLIATAIKGIEFKVFRKSSNNKRTALDEHPLLSLIHRPNAMTSGAAFFEGWIVSLLHSGNAYVERVGPRPGAPPRELYVQRPDRMFVMPQDLNNAKNGLVKGYSYQNWFSAQSGLNPVWLPDYLEVNGIKGQPVHQILHSKYYNPVDDFYGLSPLETAARSVDQINSAEEWNAATLQHGGRPSGFLAIKDANYEQTLEYEAKFLTKHTGPRNAGKTIITNGEVSYARVSSTAQEMDWIEGQELATRRICSIFRVPTELIGDSRQRTYSNYHEAKQSFYTEAILPLCDFLVGEFNYWLQPFFGEDVEIGYDKEDIEALQEDNKYVADRALNGFRAGALTRDDYRKEIGLEPLGPGIGDVFLVPTQVVPTPSTQKVQPNPVQALDPAEPGAPARTPRPRPGDGTQPSSTNQPPRPQLVPKPVRA
jgi:HK97 family phage portal protein